MSSIAGREEEAAAGPDPFVPADLGPVTLANRFIKSATFEGMAEHGLVTGQLIDFHRAVATGGVGMTTLAYLAVSRDGRGAPNEIVVRPEAVEGLTALVEAVHEEGARASAQLGHAGPVAAGTGGRALSPSRTFVPMAGSFTRPVTTADIRRITEDFAAASRLLRDAGFDAVEIHLGHNYLLSAFLSPALNRRGDRWGGGIENRAAFPREVCRAVRAAVGSEMAVLAKFNMVDGYDGGLWLDDSLAAARLLESDGVLDALVLTGGSSLRNPMYLFRGEAPIDEMAEAFPQPVRMGIKLFGSRFLHSYPFEEAYFLPYARQFRDALDMPLVLLGGINRLDTVRQAAEEGFEFVAMARALLREPDLVNRWRAQEEAAEEPVTPGLCIHCNKCMPTIYEGTHCVLVEPSSRPGTRRA